MIRIVMIRDFPGFPHGWRGSYCLPSSSKKDVAEQRAKDEILKTGGKYGAVLYYGLTGGQILTIPQNFKP